MTISDKPEVGIRASLPERLRPSTTGPRSAAELQFLALEDTNEQAPESRYGALIPANRYNVDYVPGWSSD
jgi:hypothetical protein